MSDTPSDDRARATDPWGNPLPPDQVRPTPPPGPAPSREGIGSAPPGPPFTPPTGWTPAPRPPASSDPSWGPFQHGAADTWNAPAPPRTEGMATGAMVAGIVGLLCGVIGCLGLVVGPIGVVLGLVARNKIDRSGGTLTGRPMATAGLVCGALGTLISIIWLVVIVANPDLMNELRDRLTTTTTGG